MTKIRYEYSVEDNLSGSKFSVKATKGKKEKIMPIILSIGLILSVALLIVDIVSKSSVVLDIIFIAIFISIFIFEKSFPKIMQKRQKKYFYKQNLDKIKICEIIIDNAKLTEIFYGNENELLGKNEYKFANLSSIGEDSKRLYALFENTFMVVINKTTLNELDISNIRNRLKLAVKQNSNKQ